jgi:hypothetical protein
LPWQKRLWLSQEDVKCATPMSEGNDEAVAAEEEEEEEEEAEAEEGGRRVYAMMRAGDDMACT